MIINFNHAKRIAAGCLAMSSCAFFLWINQSGALADLSNAGQPPIVAEKQGTTSLNEKNVSITSNESGDKGNYAYLDQVQIDNNGNLNVKGWHATNSSQGRPYHYIIAYDTTNHCEINRKNVTESEILRPDVASAHNVYGATNSGFQASFKLGTNIAKLSQIQIISRYTNDVAGNGDYVDYWFTPILVDRNNYAHLDNVTANDGSLVVSGWHATNLAANKPYHYVIILDQSDNNREVGRCLIKKSILRSDVANVYTGIENAVNSGFTASFSLAGINLNHQLVILSRYSSSADGNSNYVDYWFNPITNENEKNQGYIDSYDLSDGKKIVFKGWHVNRLGEIERNHFLILYDQTINKQAGVVKASTIQRPDVAKAYPEISQAAQSGFDGSFNLSDCNLVTGHSYALVSRYSTSSLGNGDQGQYVDYWFAPFALDQQAAWLDGVKMTNKGLQVNGWVASDQFLTKPNAYLIVLNNSQEVKRIKLSLKSRPDVGKTYRYICNSANSGFSQLIKFNPAQITGKMKLILRLSGSLDGNSDYVDLLNNQYGSNDGYFDQVNVNQDSIYISGWHACDQSGDKPYQWLIFLDANGHELYRRQVLDVHNSRNDLSTNRSYILNAGQSGFKLWFTIPSQLQNHVVQIIHRITDDKNGNGNYIDLYSGRVDINAYEERLRDRWQQIASSYAMPVEIAIQMADTGKVISFTNVSGQNFITASTVKVGILEKLLHNQGGYLTGSQLATATKMIEVSDNAAATNLYYEIGGMNGLNQLYAELGLTSTYCAGHWALTTTTATDQLKILHEIFLNPNSTYLNSQGQQTIQRLMAHVTPSQTWGISAGSTNFYLKNGWTTTDAWNVSSIGYIPGKYTIAVYTKNPSFDTCRNLIQQLALATRQIVG